MLPLLENHHPIDLMMWHAYNNQLLDIVRHRHMKRRIQIDVVGLQHILMFYQLHVNVFPSPLWLISRPILYEEHNKKKIISSTKYRKIESKKMIALTFRF